MISDENLDHVGEPVQKQDARIVVEERQNFHFELSPHMDSDHDVLYILSCRVLVDSGYMNCAVRLILPPALS